MDRNCPEFLRDTAQSGYDDSAELIGALAQPRPPDIRADAAFRADLDRSATRSLRRARARASGRVHPEPRRRKHRRDEVGRRACSRGIAAIWTSTITTTCCAVARCTATASISTRQTASGWRETGAVASHCPTSNLFLGSGLFDFDKAGAANMPVALATDVGGGTSFSMLQTMNEAHKIARLTGHHLTATRMFWLATTGAAEAARSGGQGRHARSRAAKRISSCSIRPARRCWRAARRARNRSKNCCSRSRCSAMIARCSRLMRPAIACIGGARARRRRWNSPLKSAIDPARMRAPWRLNRHRNHPAIGGAVQPGRFFIHTGRQGRARSLACR